MYTSSTQPGKVCDDRYSVCDAAAGVSRIHSLITYNTIVVTIETGSKELYGRGGNRLHLHNTKEDNIQ